MKVAMKFYVFLVGAALFSFAGKAHATLSGIIWIPSTDIQAFGVAHFGVDTFNCLSKASSARTVATINYGITVGVIPDQRIFEAEAGIDYRDVGGSTDKPWFYNAKIGLKEGKISPWQPALAVGVYDFGGRKDITSANFVYGLAAKNISGVGRIGLGYFTGNEKVLINETGWAENTGLLASWDRSIGSKFWTAVDYMSGQSSYGALSFGLSYIMSEKFSFIFGYDIYNNDRLHVPTFTFQLDVNL
jgi:hypothetical protein